MSAEGNCIRAWISGQKAATRQTVESRLSPALGPVQVRSPLQPALTNGRLDGGAEGRRRDRGGGDVQRRGEVALQRHEGDRRRRRVDRSYGAHRGRDAHLIARPPCLIT